MRRKIPLLVALVCALSISAAEETVPPPPAGVTDLKFGELLATPVGERGLSFSERAKSLAGKRVRVAGYMVRQESTIPGRFLLTPVPVQLHDEHYGLADDLPAATVFVSSPSAEKEVIQYKAGLLLVTGVLSTGNREESDGRISIFRIAMEPPHDLRKIPLLQSTKPDQTRAGAGSLK
jgi:hypothetical protein